MGSLFELKSSGEVNSPLRKFSAALRIYGAYRAAPPLAGFWVAAQKKSGLPKKSALL